MSAAFQAPSGASTSRVAHQPRSLEQKICAQLLGLTTEQIGEALRDPQNPTKPIDTGTASRIRSGERSMVWRVWIRLMDYMGYKLVSKDKLCVPAYELQMLRDAYGFVGSSPEMSARFSAWRETKPLEQDFDAE